MHGIHLSVARKNESLARCFCASWLRPEKARSAVRQRTQYQIALETFTLGHKCFRKKSTLKQMSWNILLWKTFLGTNVLRTLSVHYDSVWKKRNLPCANTHQTKLTLRHLLWAKNV